VKHNLPDVIFVEAESREHLGKETLPELNAKHNVSGISCYSGKKYIGKYKLASIIELTNKTEVKELEEKE
jgi:hypothetical protein